MLTFLLLACADPEPADRPSRQTTTTAETVPAMAADVLGPYPVGVWTFGYTDPRGKELVVEVWYPAVVAPDDEPDPYPPTNISGVGHRNADRAQGPFPLIAFSHGSGAIRFQSVFLMEHLASHGFVVVAPDHPLSTMFDIDGDATVDVLLERPDDVRFTVDELIRRATTPGDYVEGLVADEGRYAAIGHSFGAITLLSLAGAEWDTAGVEQWCVENEGRSQACRYVDVIDPSLTEGHGGPDPRVIATVPLSPGLWYAFGPDGEGLADVAMPMVLAGDKDDVLPYDVEARPTWERMAAPRALGTFADAGHYPFSDLCELAPFIQPECLEDGWMDIDEVQAASVSLITAWMRRAFDTPGPGDDTVLDPASWGGDIVLEID